MVIMNKNTARVQNCPEITILDSLFGHGWLRHGHGHSHEHWSWSKIAKKRLDFLYVFKVALSLVTKGIGIELPGQPKIT